MDKLYTVVCPDFFETDVKCQNHEEDFFQFMCASQKVRTLKDDPLKPPGTPDAS